MEALILLWLLSHLGKGGGLKPGMTGLLDTNVPGQPLSLGVGVPYGFVAVRTAAGVLGWTNVQSKDNHKLRTAFPQGSRATFVVGADPSLGAFVGTRFAGVRDGDGMNGGPFFRAV